MSEIGEAPERSGAAGLGLTSLADASALRPTIADATLRFASGIIDEIKDDRWLYAGVLLYAGLGWTLATLNGRMDLYQPLLYVTSFLPALVGLLIPGLVVSAAIFAVIEQPKAPLPVFRKELVSALNPRLVAGALLFFSTAVFYATFTGVKNLLPEFSGFDWDPILADIDRFLHGGYDPASVLSQAINPMATLALDYIYARTWATALLAITIWAAVTRRHAHLRVPFFLTYFFCWPLIGNLLAGAFLSGGPCYYDVFTGDLSRFAGLKETLEGTNAVAYQDYLWRVHVGDSLSFASGISAFPSMHLSVTTYLALFLWYVDRRLGILGALFTLLMLVGSVRLGWHYAIDGYVSIVVTILVWHGVCYACRRGWFGARAIGAP